MEEKPVMVDNSQGPGTPMCVQESEEPLITHPQQNASCGHVIDSSVSDTTFDHTNPFSVQKCDNYPERLKIKVGKRVKAKREAWVIAKKRELGERPRYFKQEITESFEIDDIDITDNDQYKVNIVADSAEPQIGKKRKAKDDDLPLEIKAKKMKTMNKTPVSALNELCPGIVYTYSSDTSRRAHEPCFTCSVDVQMIGKIIRTFTASASSKKAAKHAVAAKVFKALGVDMASNKPAQNPVSQAQPQPFRAPFAYGSYPPEGFTLPRDFPASMIPGHPGNGDFGDVVQQNEEIDYTVDDIESPLKQCAGIDPALVNRLHPATLENPLQAINNLFGVEVTFEEEGCRGPPHQRVFTMKLLYQKREYYGRGSTKKQAKTEAAQRALIDIIGESTYNTYFGCLAQPSNHICMDFQSSQDQDSINSNTSVPIPTEVLNADAEHMEYSKPFAEQIEKLIIDKFIELTDRYPAFATQKVLAGVVLTQGTPLLDDAVVIAVSTGTKCIEGGFMSVCGLAVNDCHAEVLSNRCVRDFLYSHVDLAFDNPDSSVLEQIPDNNRSIPRLRIKEGIKFHLYISTSPCGDARIFSPKGLEDQEFVPGEEPTDAHPARVNRGVLRAKIEAGEGTIPVANINTGTEGPQTWDAIVQGCALRTMSCSDKVCQWNVLGLQGALLSYFVEPVYYSSVILGGLHHPVHFRRSLITRIESFEPLMPSPMFKINKPHLLMVGSETKREVKKSPNHAVCWALGWECPDIIAASKGRCENGGVVSRIAKKIFFIRFRSLYNKLYPDQEKQSLSYRDTKYLSKEFQLTKSAFKQYMKDSGYGSWVSKPVDQDTFTFTTK